MAALTPKTLYVGNTSTANVYTVNSSATSYTIVKSISICNANASSAKTANVYIIPASGSAAENNIYISSLSIPANDVVQIDTTLILSNGYSIYMTHSGNVTTVISGVEYV
jgi:IMP cyclohydrolase